MKPTILRHADFFQVMDNWAPKSLAYDWDNVGLQVGRFHDDTKRVLVTLDVTEGVVDEAIEKQANLIIAHHPLLFQPLKQINLDHPKGRVIQKLLKHHITVFAAHTNLDIAAGGVNDLLSEAIGLKQTEPLETLYQEDLYKVVIYVPETHVEAIRNAFHESGAGHIGNYSHCTFQSGGEGTFKPLEGTNPHIGKQNALTFVSEKKIETIVPKKILSDVLNTILSAHPYEEPAYDIYPLANKGEAAGIGRVGSLEQSMPMEAFIQWIKEQLDIRYVRVSGKIDKNVKRVAVLGGSGEKYIRHAWRQKADVYITGDITFHPAQDAEQMGLTIIDAGHYIEKIMKKATQQRIIQDIPAFSKDVLVSDVNTDPFHFM